MTQITRHEIIHISYRPWQPQGEYVAQLGSFVITRSCTVSTAYDEALRYAKTRMRDFPHIKIDIEFDEKSRADALEAGAKWLKDYEAEKCAEVLASLSVKPKRAVRLA